MFLLVYLLFDRCKPQGLYPSAKLYSKFFKFKTPFTHYPFASCLLPFVGHFLTTDYTDYTDLFFSLIDTSLFPLNFLYLTSSKNFA